MPGECPTLRSTERPTSSTKKAVKAASPAVRETGIVKWLDATGGEPRHSKSPAKAPNKLRRPGPRRRG